MSTVTITPMHAYLRKVKPLYRHLPPPVFPDGNPSAADVELAAALFGLLDAESQDWYRAGGAFKSIHSPTEKDPT